MLKAKSGRKVLRPIITSHTSTCPTTHSIPLPRILPSNVIRKWWREWLKDRKLNMWVTLEIFRDTMDLFVDNRNFLIAKNANLRRIIWTTKPCTFGTPCDSHSFYYIHQGQEKLSHTGSIAHLSSNQIQITPNACYFSFTSFIFYLS